MAKSNVANVKEVNFRFSIAKISKLSGKIWSPEYLIDGVPWKVYAYKSVSGAAPSLGLFLHCTNPDKSSAWSHVASATFELSPSKSDCASTKRETGPFVFDHLYKDYGFRTFIRWNELFDVKNGYVMDDTIDLQIGIRAETNKAHVTSFENITKSCDDGCVSTFRVTVSNIEGLTAVKTPEFIFQKFPCEWLLFKRSNKLGVNPIFKSNNKADQNVIFLTELEVILVSSNVAMERRVKVKGVIGQGNSFHVRHLISWAKLLEPKNGYVKDGTITIEFEIKTEQSGSTPNAKKRKTVDDQPTAVYMKLDCKICKKPITNQEISSLPCGHMFCSPCITDSLKVRKVCPSCDVRARQNGLRRILLPKSN